LYGPYETYIKTLYNLYHEELEEEELSSSKGGSHALLDFQIKNVHALLRRLKKYKVAMLADSVGLGKTYTAIEVIKQYINGEEGRRRIEIICPKSLKSQWEKELTTQAVYNHVPVTLQNPQEIERKRGLDDIASVALFVIDESHNLKNRAGKRFYQIIEWIRNNPKADVLLLTATPINNQLADIATQILLGTRGQADVLKVTAVDKLKHTEQINFHEAIENLNKKINQDLKRNGSIDFDYVKQIMMPILRAFVVRRTRQGIEKEYGGLTIDGKKLGFPKVQPEVQKYGFKKEIARKMRAMQSESLDLQSIFKLSPDQIIDSTKKLLHPLNQIQGLEGKLADAELQSMSAIYFVYQMVLLLGFVPYRWQMYKTRFYGKTRQEIRDMKIDASERKTLFLQLSIYGILRTMFLKRLESSVSAIRSSLDTYKRKLDVFERGIEFNKIVSLKDLANIEEQLGMGDEDIDPDDLVLDEESELDTIDDKRYALAALKEDIQRERSLIHILDQQLDILQQDDSKTQAFGTLLEKLSTNKPAGSKVLVFSFFADTIEYLQRDLPKYVKCITPENSAFVSSRNRAGADSLAGRFSPTAKKYVLKDGESELNYLFSTDVLSEGQNLQDCGILINYDLHWNPVRMIQRNGRINRLGSEHDKVFIYNVSPEAQLEEYLKLVSRLGEKINLIRNTIGTDTPVLEEQENPIEFTDSLKDVYSDDLQVRLAALEKSEKDADFLLSEDEYVTDLKIFHNDPKNSEEHRSKVYGIPQGKWACMPEHAHRVEKRPDVLCLNALQDSANTEIGHRFVAMDRNGDKFQSITHLQALEWLRTSPDDIRTQADKISLDKVAIAENVLQKITTYTDKKETGSPVGQQTELLRIMFENHCSAEDIELVRLSFQTRNVLYKEEIKRLLRRIVRQKRNNEGYLDDMNDLIKIARKTQVIATETQEFSQATQQLFYIERNE